MPSFTPYIYGIRKSAKRNLRWISGVRKGKDEGKIEGKPGGSIAGSGQVLVGVLTQIMHELKSKDAEGTRRGEPKRCWFVESVEEVAQPLRFEASKGAKHNVTADIVDFVTMYPSFAQTKLKERLRDSVQDSWDWRHQKLEGR